MKRKFFLPYVFLLTACSQSEEERPQVMHEQAPYEISVKCAAMAKSLKDHSIQIGGQDFAKLEQLAFINALNKGRQKSKDESQVQMDLKTEVERIDKSMSDAKTTTVVTNSDSKAPPPNFGNNLRYLTLAITFEQTTPCIKYFGAATQ